MEAGYLAAAGWQLTGIDSSQVALARAVAGHDGAAFMRADVCRTFAAWQIEHMQRAAVPSDTRTLEVIPAQLSTTSPP